MQLRGLGQRPLIFIVHSLGGLLVKELLRTAHTQNNPAWKGVSASTIGVLFLATPHAGAPLATLAGLFRSVIRRNWTLRDLEAHEPHLRDLNEWFRSNFQLLGLKAHVLRESQAIGGVMVVNPTSADPGIVGVRVIPVDKHHISICKPSSREDQVFLETLTFVGDCIRSMVQRKTTEEEARSVLLPNPATGSPSPGQVTLSADQIRDSSATPQDLSRAAAGALAALSGGYPNPSSRVESLVDQIQTLLKTGRHRACGSLEKGLEQLLNSLPRRGMQVREGWIMLARLEDQRLHMAKQEGQEIDVSRLRFLYKEAENVID
jgi:hypothetical protein